jgi:hypothetical protein
VDKEHSYEVTAELPGMDPSNITVKFSTGTLTIKGKRRRKRKRRVANKVDETTHGLATADSLQAVGCRPLEQCSVKRAPNCARKPIERLEFIQRAPIAVAREQIVDHFLSLVSGMLTAPITARP